MCCGRRRRAVVAVVGRPFKPPTLRSQAVSARVVCRNAANFSSQLEPQRRRQHTKSSTLTPAVAILFSVSPLSLALSARSRRTAAAAATGATTQHSLCVAAAAAAVAATLATVLLQSPAASFVVAAIAAAAAAASAAY